MTRTILINPSCDAIRFARILKTSLNEHIINEQARYEVNCNRINFFDNCLHSINEQCMMGDEDVLSQYLNHPDLVTFHQETKYIHRELYWLECFKYSLLQSETLVHNDTHNSMKLLTDERIMMMTEDLKSRNIYIKSYVKQFNKLLDSLAELNNKFSNYRKQFSFLFDENYIILLKILEMSM
jgi:hypothetical protein